jgi:hypothetical protein
MRYFNGKFGSIPLKDHHFGSIPLLSHLHVGPHESMTCGVHGIYLKFGSFNGIDPIVPILIDRHSSLFLYSMQLCFRFLRSIPTIINLLSICSDRFRHLT